MKDTENNIINDDQNNIINENVILEDDPELGGNLNIGELLNARDSQPEKVQQPEVQQDDISQEKETVVSAQPSQEAAKSVKAVMTDLETDSIRQFAESMDVSFALDKNGKRYDINAIETEMKKEGAGLFLFTSDGALPYLVRNQGGKLMISDEPISSQHLLPEREDNQIQRFEARPSLQISDIVKLSASQKRLEAEKEKIKNASKADKPAAEKKFRMQEKIEVTRDKQRKGMKEANQQQLNNLIRQETKKLSDAYDELTEVGNKLRLFDKEEKQKVIKQYCELEHKEPETIGMLPEDPGPALKKPVRSFFQLAASVALRIVTVGQVDTQTNKKYLEDMRKYEEQNARIEEYKQEEQRVKAELDEVNGYITRRKQQLEQQRDEIKNRISESEKHFGPNGDFEKTQKEIIRNFDPALFAYQQYTNLTEVRMEGVADYVRSGKVTPENLFAYTWMKKQELQNLDLENEQRDIDKLSEYIAAKVIEKKLHGIISAEGNQADPRFIESELRDLNSGQAARKIAESPQMKSILSGIGAGQYKADPDAICAIYEEKAAQALNNVTKNPLERLKSERERIAEQFGTKEPSNDCKMDVRNYLAAGEKLRIMDQGVKSGTNPNRYAHTVNLLIGEMHSKDVTKNSDPLLLKYSDEMFNKAFDKVIGENKGKQLSLGQLSKQVLSEHQKVLNSRKGRVQVM